MHSFSHPVLAAFGIGGTELIVILLIILLLFGGSKLPALAKGLGESVREFKKASREGDEETKKADAAKTSDSHGKN